MPCPSYFYTRMKSLLLLFFGCLSISLQAQKMYLSEKSDYVRRNDSYQILSKYQGMFTIYQRHAGISELHFFDSTGIPEKVSSLSFLPDQPEWLFFASSSKQITVFFVGKENKQQYVYASQLQANFSWTSPIVIDSCSTRAYRISSGYQFVSSANHQQTLLYTHWLQEGKEMLRLLVVDDKLQTRTRIEQALPETSNYLSSQAIVSNQGDAFLLGSSRDLSLPSETLSLLQIYHGATEYISTRIDTKDQPLNDIHLAYNENNQGLALAAWFRQARYSSPKGIFSAFFQPSSRTFISQSFTPIRLQIGSSRSDLNDLEIRDMYLNTHGDIEISAEKYSETTRSISTFSPNMSVGLINSNIQENVHTVKDYAYQEIVVFHLAGDGSLLWNQHILKEQSSTDDKGLYSSFCVMENKWGKAFLFNDISSRQNRFLAAYLSGKGDINVREVPLPAETDDWSLIPREGQQVSSRELIVPCQSKNYLCFLIIRY